ncbi:TPA: hypothetical protein HA295_01300 [Candidatus Woesearchaeota archaeon]|nr:hypothetical protein [Candidatus Woesearchaeota archaeon]
MRLFPLVVVFVLSAVMLTACVQQQATPQEEMPQQTAPQDEAAAPEQQTAPSAQQQAPETRDAIEEGIKPLLQQASARVKSLRYKYEGPETNKALFDFYVKGTKAAYAPENKNDYSAPDDYNIIYLDTATQTAASYCDHRTCNPRGKRADLVYSAVSLPTPLDWLGGITSANHVGQEQIEQRSVTIVQTNNGKLWIDNYYGAPMRAEKDGVLYHYKQMAFNDVTDAQVSPQ